jgi:hypothetical protein
MRRLRNQTYRAPRFAAAGLVTANRGEPGVFALRAGIRLQRNGVETGDGLELCAQFGEQLRVALGLIDRREWVQLREFRP